MVGRSKAMGISLPEEIWRKIDRLRGDVPRSVFIRRLIEKYLSQEEARHK